MLRKTIAPADDVRFHGQGIFIAERPGWHFCESWWDTETVGKHGDDEVRTKQNTTKRNVNATHTPRGLRRVADSTCSKVHPFSFFEICRRLKFGACRGHPRCQKPHKHSLGTCTKFLFFLSFSLLFYFNLNQSGRQYTYLQGRRMRTTASVSVGSRRLASAAYDGIWPRPPTSPSLLAYAQSPLFDELARLEARAVASAPTGTAPTAATLALRQLLRVAFAAGLPSATLMQIAARLQRLVPTPTPIPVQSLQRLQSRHPPSATPQQVATRHLLTPVDELRLFWADYRDHPRPQTLVVVRALLAHLAKAPPPPPSLLSSSSPSTRLPSVDDDEAATVARIGAQVARLPTPTTTLDLRATTASIIDTGSAAGASPVWAAIAATPYPPPTWVAPKSVVNATTASTVVRGVSAATPYPRLTPVTPKSVVNAAVDSRPVTAPYLAEPSSLFTFASAPNVRMPMPDDFPVPSSSQPDNPTSISLTMSRSSPRDPLPPLRLRSPSSGPSPVSEPRHSNNQSSLPQRHITASGLRHSNNRRSRPHRRMVAPSTAATVQLMPPPVQVTDTVPGGLTEALASLLTSPSTPEV